MKKTLFFVIAILLAITVNAQNISLRSSNTGIAKSVDNFSGFEATFSFNQIESVTITGTERGTFSALTIPGAYQGGELGTPELPMFKKMIAVPVDATPRVIVKNFTSTEYNLSEYGIQTVFPAQADVRKDQEPSEIPFAYDAKAYSADEYTNSEIASVEILGTMRGIILGMLYVNPVQYNPANHSIMVYNDIEVEVIFENGNYAKTQELYRNTYSPYFAELYKITFNNGSKDMFDDHPDLYNIPVRMLVVANRMFESTLQPWIEWKTKKGFIMDVNYTDDIGTSAAAIKTFCHGKYNAGATNGTAPTFIVFVGDTPQLPASQTGSQSQKATDLYYAKVNTGSYWFPDMYYSRMSAQTTQQLENQIEKILYYEKYEFADPTYLDNVLLIAGWDSYWQPKVGAPQINYANNYYYNAEHGFANIHKYLNPYTGCYAHFDNVGFANYTAHCNETSWADPSFSISQINSINNQNKYFVAMGNCCLAADFGFSGNGGICFGEAMMNAQQKAAVGYIGSSPSSYWGGDFHFAVGAYAGNIETVTNPTLENTKDGCYDLAFRDADFNCLSSFIYGGNLSVTYAHSNGYTTHVHANYYWEAYNVLGDGSLMPYNSQAADNDVSHMPVLYIGLPTYEVNAEPGSYVAISKDGVLYGTAVANENGLATVTLSPPITSGGDVDIVVTRNQYKPYIATVEAVAQSGSYVTGTVELSAQNAPYCDATVFFDITLKNVGIETATDIQIDITTESNDVTIIENVETISALAAGEEQTLSQIFKTEINNNLLDGTQIIFNLNIISDNNTFSKSYKVEVLAPKLEIEDVKITKTSGTGTIAPGDEVKIDFEVANVGHDAISDVFSTALSFYSGFELFESQQTIAQINAGENKHITFTGKVGDDVEDRSIIPIHFNVLKNVYSTEEIGYVVVGSTMEDFETGDFTKFNWEQGTNPWEITTSNVYQGTYSARSKNNLAHSASSQLKITTYAASASTVSYARNASSETNYDWFRFYVDGVQKEQLSGTSNSWAIKSFPVDAGVHTYMFEYSKDVTISSGSDCAWIDNVSIPGMGVLVTEDLPLIKVMDYTVEGLIDDVMVGEAQITFDIKNIGVVDAENVMVELSCEQPICISAEDSCENITSPFLLNIDENKSVTFNLEYKTIVYPLKSEVEYIEFMLKVKLGGDKSNKVVAYYPVVLKCINEVIIIGGIDDNEEIYCKLYPNPANTAITIETKEPISYYEIIDITGKVVDAKQNINNNATLVNVATLPNGIYFVKIIDNKQKMAIKKFVKQ